MIEQDLFGESRGHLFESGDVENATSSSFTVYQLLAAYYNHISPSAKTDVDLFLYSLTKEEAEQKIEEIYEVIKENIKNRIPIKYISDALNTEFTWCSSQKKMRRMARENDIVITDDILLITTRNTITISCSFPV